MSEVIVITVAQYIIVPAFLAGALTLCKTVMRKL